MPIQFADALVVAALGLMCQSGSVLLDAVPDPGLPGAIRGALENEGDRVADLHLWRLGGRGPSLPARSRGLTEIRGTTRSAASSQPGPMHIDEKLPKI